MNGYTGELKIKELDVIGKIAEAATPETEENNNEINTVN